MRTEIERLLAAAPDPHALIDDEGFYRYVNPAAQEFLGPGAGLAGDPSPFSESVSHEFHGRLRRTYIGSVEVEFTRIRFESNRGILTVVRFTPTGRSSRRNRQLEAIVTMAKGLTETDRLDSALGKLAQMVVGAAHLESCAVTLLEPDLRIRVAGTVGLPDNYAELLEACRRRGAPLATVRAHEEGSVVVDAKWREIALEDVRWQPLHETIRSLRFGTLIAVPIRVQDPSGTGEILGALTAYCREDAELNHDDVDFLQATADYAAIGISNARMARRLRKQAAYEERLRLSRELHDSVTQELFSLSLRTKAMAKDPRITADPELAAELSEMHDQTRRALDQMRATILRGRPIEIGPDGVSSALRKSLEQLDLPEGLAVEIDDEKLPTSLAHDLQEDAFLLVLEAIRNAVKHSGATTIAVELTEGEQPGSLVATISDDGTGFISASRSAGSIGIDAMRERTHTHGGSFSINSRPGYGTSIIAVFPPAITKAMAESEDA